VAAPGQFLSLDPEVATTLQPYAYTVGNPVAETDPTGLASWPPWPIIGERCPGNAYSWCDMFFFITTEDVLGAIHDEIKVRVKVDPHWDSADIIYQVVTTNPLNYLSDFRLKVYPICDAGTAHQYNCMYGLKEIDGQGGGRWKAQYGQGNDMKGHYVAFGLQLGAHCPECTSSNGGGIGKWPLTPIGQTQRAKCRVNVDSCRFT
jgi:hypothetical protein